MFKKDYAWIKILVNIKEKFGSFLTVKKCEASGIINQIVIILLMFDYVYFHNNIFW